MCTYKKKLECLKKVILNSLEHKRANDPVRIYSQYIRYALDEFKDINFYQSKEAKLLKRKDVIHEHVIPHSIVMNKLLTLDPLTTENIGTVIQKYYVICAITKEEDRLLTARKLRSEMPQNWDGEKDSVFARYEEVGIKFNKKIKSIR